MLVPFAGRAATSGYTLEGRPKLMRGVLVALVRRAGWKTGIPQEPRKAAGGGSKPNEDPTVYQLNPLESRLTS
jgi:hypothetical protein